MPYDYMKWFTRSEDGESAECQIDNCKKKLNTRYKYNYKKHILNCHEARSNEWGLLKDDPKGGKITLHANKNTIIEGCVKMVTLHNLPYNVFEYDGFKQIVQPLFKELQIKIDCRTIIPRVKDTADQIRNQIKREIKGKMVCLKIDSATRLDRSIVGINLQFIENSCIKIRTIAMVEIFERQTASNLRELILDVLYKYELNIKQIYTCTTDNGANMIKTIGLLKDVQELESNTEPIASQFDLNIENNGDVTMDDEAEHEDHTDDESDDDDFVEDFERIEIEPSSLLTVENAVEPILDSVRCVAHTLQLAINDVINIDYKIREIIINGRILIKKLRTKTFKLARINLNLKKPPLDVITRWNSTFLMMQYLDDNQDVLKTLQILDDDRFRQEFWQNVKLFVRAFKPPYAFTKKLQKSSLTVGDFFLGWAECELLLQTINNDFANSLIAAMNNRKQQIMKSPAIQSTLYMDPRINYAGSRLLSKEMKEIAMDHLQKTWKKICNLQEQNETIEPLITNESANSSNDSILEKFLLEQCEETNQTSGLSSNLAAKLTSLSFRERLRSGESVLDYWESKKYEEPEMYKIFEVVGAVPATQVTVERAFCSLPLILTKRRCSLKPESLQDILIVKLNKEYFEKNTFVHA